MKRDDVSAAGPPQRAGGPSRRIWRRAAIVMATVALCMVSGPALALATEAGLSIPARLAPKSLLLDAVWAGERIWAVGERGHVLFSADNGQTWQQVQVPTRAMLTGITFHDDRLGWAVGHDAVILRTTDGGQSWQKVHEAPDDFQPLFDVWFQDALNGFAIGAYGLCLRTRDGGNDWESVRISDDDWHLHHLARSPGGRLYIAAEAGQVYRSDDGGDTWMTLPSPYGGSFFGVLPLKEDALIAFGLRGHVFGSEDAGETWQRIPTGTVATLASGIFLDDGRILLAGLVGTVLVGREQNTSFAPVPGPGRRSLWAVLQTPAQDVIGFGEGGSVRLSPGD